MQTSEIKVVPIQLFSCKKLIFNGQFCLQLVLWHNFHYQAKFFLIEFQATYFVFCLNFVFKTCYKCFNFVSFWVLSCFLLISYFIVHFQNYFCNVDPRMYLASNFSFLCHTIMRQYYNKKFNLLTLKNAGYFDC